MSRTVAVRDEVLRFVRAHPGVHVREVERQLGLSSRLASHHLDALEHEGAVHRVAQKGYTRFLDAQTARTLTGTDLEWLLAMRRPVATRIVLLLLDEGERTHGALATALGVPRASASYHLAGLQRAGLALARSSGRERLYSLRDPGRVRGILRRFPPVPGQLGSFDSIWSDLFG